MTNHIERAAIGQSILPSIRNTTEIQHNPVSNTGVEVDVTRFGLGWFSFTFRRADGCDAYPCVIQFTNQLTRFTSPHLERTRAGVNGYNQARCYSDGVIVAWSIDREDIFVSLPQTALDRLEPKRLAKLLYWCAALPGFHLTRLDVFFDDYSKNVTPAKFERELLNGNYPGRATQWQTIGSFNKSDFEGYTVYVGSNHSDFRVRCYDKNLESQGKIDATRVEFQLRSETAQSYFAALIFSDYRSWGIRAFALLLSKFDFFQRAGKRNLKTSRRVDWWAVFAAGNDAVGWRVEQKAARFLRTIAWMEKIFPVQLALLGELLGPLKLSDWVDTMLVDGRSRITDRHRAVLNDMLSQIPSS